MASNLKKLLRLTGKDLVSLFIGFAAVGWLLSIQQIHFILWLVLHGVIGYLSWAGSGALALSLLCITVVMWTATLSTSGNFEYWPTLPILTSLNPAQLWAIVLVLSWLLATLLAFHLAHIAQSMDTVGVGKNIRFLLLGLTVLLGLHLGRLIEIKTIFG